MKKKIIFCISWLAVWAAACSPVKILNTEGSDNFSLGNYQSFGFMETEAGGDALGTDYSQQLEFVKAEIARQLEARGLEQRTADPDLAVNIGVVVSEEVQTRQTDLRSDPPTYIGQRRYTWRSREVEVGRYNEGTLSLHLVDRMRDELVWRGEAEAVVPRDREKQERRISEGIEKLVQRIP